MMELLEELPCIDRVSNYALKGVEQQKYFRNSLL